MNENNIIFCHCRVLSHFKTTHKQYSVIFTSGCTAALKLVAESFKFDSDERLLRTCQKSTAEINSQVASSLFAYLDDNHTSVIGMREIIKQRGFMDIACVSPKNVEDWLHTSVTKPEQEEHLSSSQSDHLFVYPAQSNFSGQKYPLEWIETIQTIKPNGCKDGDWYVLLDAAGFVSTSALDLSMYKPDFVALSFYKMFGFPTGLGMCVC